MAAEENTRWLMEQWTAALAAAIESMSEQRPEVQFAAQPAAEPEEGGGGAQALSWEQSFKGIQPAALWVRAPEKTWLEIGGRTLRAAGIEAAEPADARNTYLEILNQSLSYLAQAISGRRGEESACERGAERQPPDQPRFRVALRFADAELALEVTLSPAFLEALDQAGTGAAVEPAETGASESPDAFTTPPPGASKTMDLLLDVDLPVSVSFGRTELPVKEILKLTTGSIVELNRSLNEPVDVIVNNCVVARGEVVVIEGNYGVRIHQILSRQDRLRSLR